MNESDLVLRDLVEAAAFPDGFFILKRSPVRPEAEFVESGTAI
jgi:hypothetical protein